MGGLTERGERSGPDADVLVVGAGPVGLVLGCELVQQGVRVRVVDAARGHTGHSRANVVWPRNLELLDRIGVSAELAAEGHHLQGTAFYSDGELLAAARLSALDDTPYPFAVMIAQERTEQILERRLRELGGTVERGVVLRSLAAEGPDGLPRAVLEHPDGRREETSPGWVLGADGAHSTVRKELGIGYAGPQVDVSFAITDALLETTLGDDLSHYCYSPNGAIVLGPMGGGVFRIAVNVPHDAYSDDNPPRLDVFQELVDKRAAGRTTVRELLWSGAFRVRVRLAEAFRRGRCFLVGDAAHVISPAGGQGMNTGMQDAVNLAWRLGGVLRGALSPDALDDYDTERRTTSQLVSRATALMTRAALAGTADEVAERDAAFRAADASGLFQRWMAPQLGQTDTHYGRPDGAVAPAAPVSAADWLAEFSATVPEGRVGVGGRLPLLTGAPDGPSWDGASWPRVDRDRRTVLLWPGEDGSGAEDCARVRATLGEATAALTLDARVPDALRRALGPAAAAALIRPDGHLLARTALDAAEIHARLEVPAHAD
ncbi:2-polyprenyl-6-methoxyphenol hydroxylase-like FAD-dependent oxidoreductase [Streptacidiphilus sp. MAP12-33]|uniref:FAD-dependent monooxygenase n=1 Tax=Streptacidiphilus sp. MAP12-33 TaxID=3156266 RepID=UPI003512E299